MWQSACWHFSRFDIRDFLPKPKFAAKKVQHSLKFGSWVHVIIPFNTKTSPLTLRESVLKEKYFLAIPQSRSWCSVWDLLHYILSSPCYDMELCNTINQSCYVFHCQHLGAFMNPPLWLCQTHFQSAWHASALTPLPIEYLISGSDLAISFRRTYGLHKIEGKLYIYICHIPPTHTHTHSRHSS